MSFVGAIWGGPSQHQQVMQGMRDTQEMIKKLGVYVELIANHLDTKLTKIAEHFDARFDVIDKNLVTLITIANDQLKLLNHLVNQDQIVQTRLFDIQNTLRQTQLKLYDEMSRLNSSLIAQIDGLADYLTSAHLNFCFDYARAYPDRDFSSRDYLRCLSRIKAYATHRARDSIVPMDTRTDQDTFLRTVIHFRPDQTVPYLLRVLSEIYRVPVFDYEVGNPVKWKIAAESLIFMLTHYPENATELNRAYLYSTQSSQGVLDSFITHGINIIKTIASAKTTLVNNRWIPNIALFDQFVNDYKEALGALQTQMSEYKTNYLTANTHGYDFTGSLDQSSLNCTTFHGRTQFAQKTFDLGYDRAIGSIYSPAPDFKWFNNLRPLIKNFIRLQKRLIPTYIIEFTKIAPCNKDSIACKLKLFLIEVDQTYTRKGTTTTGSKAISMKYLDEIQTNSIITGTGDNQSAQIINVDRTRNIINVHLASTQSIEDGDFTIKYQAPDESRQLYHATHQFIGESDNYIHDISDIEYDWTEQSNRLIELKDRAKAQAWERLATDCSSRYETVGKQIRKEFIQAIEIEFRDFILSLRKSYAEDEGLRNRFNENIRRINYTHKILTTMIPFLLPESMIMNDRLRTTLSQIYDGETLKTEILSGSTDYKFRSCLYNMLHQDIAWDLNAHAPKNIIYKGLFKMDLPDTDASSLNNLPDRLLTELHSTLESNPQPETDLLLKNTLTSLQIYYMAH